VNLADAERPGDIYTAVSKKVQERVNKDAAEGHRIAVQLVEKIKRKVVKQTVMTSVYGVTFIGAKDQIMRQLSDRGILPEEDLKAGALYLATITMSAIADLFAGAHRIKEWFIKCAGSIAKAGYPVSWVTPLGLPVVQPYRRGNQTMFIDTFFQRVSLLSNKDNLPISVPKQKSAFPPNYVHSLDSTHLMLTAIECHKYDIMFAAVHDSFWTHACDIDLMNKLLREKFVYLHSQPLLENLLADFKARHPSIHFDPVPQLGNFDLNKVLTSTYFFA
jgi:DNA-directed RNA polymerase